MKPSKYVHSYEISNRPNSNSTLYLAGSLQVANSMRLVHLNVSLYVLVIQVSTRDSITGP